MHKTNTAESHSPNCHLNNNNTKQELKITLANAKGISSK